MTVLQQHEFGNEEETGEMPSVECTYHMDEDIRMMGRRDIDRIEAFEM